MNPAASSPHRSPCSPRTQRRCRVHRKTIVVIAGSQVGVSDALALSYGLFHAQGHPNKLYGVVTTGFTMDGLNMDVGHLRHIRWVKDDNPQSAINNKPELTQNGKTAAQNRWIAYNKMRGQYASAMEHATPEQFWVDKSTCSYTDENNQVQNPTLPACQQAISAVKAIAIAQAEGQKIYTINAQNAATALPSLPVGGDVGSEIRSAIQAGKEVTVHEKAINAFGWSGYGYTIIDPDTGGGAYLIEGRGNGGQLISDEALAALYAFAWGMFGVVAILPIILAAAYLGFTAIAILTSVILATAWMSAKASFPADSPWRTFYVDVIGGVLVAILGAIVFGITVPMLYFAIFISIVYAIMDAFIFARAESVFDEYMNLVASIAVSKIKI